MDDVQLQDAGTDFKWNPWRCLYDCPVHTREEIPIVIYIIQI